MMPYSIQSGFSVLYEKTEYAFERISIDRFGEQSISLINRRLNLPTAFSEAEICHKIQSGEMTLLTSGLHIKPGAVVKPTLFKPSSYLCKYENQVHAYCIGMEQRGITKGMRKKISLAIPEIAREILDEDPPKDSTVMRWLRITGGNSKNFKLVTENFIAQKRASRKAPEVIAVANEILDDFYFITKLHTQKPEDIETCTARINAELYKRGIVGTISLSTVKKIISKRPAYERDRIRLGATEAKHKHHHSSGGKWPSRALQRVEVDHTTLDLKVRDRLTGKDIDKPTVTVLKDCYTGYPLSIWISFQGESTARIIKAIQYALEDKSAIKDKYGLEHDWLTTPAIWEKLVMDNALAHHADAMHSLAKDLGCSFEFSTVRSPWEKGAIENFMGRMNQALPLHGRPTKPHEVKSKQSKKLNEAVVYFDDLVQYLHKWMVDLYPHKIVKRKNTSPYMEMEKAIKTYDGLPKIHFTPCSDLLRMAISKPTFHKIGSGGYETKGLTYRSRELSQLVQTIGQDTKFEIRQDINDIGEVFVCNPATNEWIVVPEMDYAISKGKPLYQHEFERKKKREDLIVSGAQQKDWNARIAQSDAARNLVLAGKKPTVPKKSAKSNRAEARARGISQDNPHGTVIDVTNQTTEIKPNRFLDPKAIGTFNNVIITA
ncbi:Mu transposase C-terminal domain-containing protein [Polynucleobacter sp. 80A-SIGWE]|uniref:Mu transposase C-terminal domain-containing protein n=1 Tax=Polynucleobacter sp. 80A-SIGWE TaxID=2689100 RepID=UPI001C0B1D83|nr:Mu transposase C-terminal domain-containing protein [Polynucleobacter sp. 80A-SIGWE]MBU3588475.1 DDE-type integrase/transposase/recombinase [Polynucleobacter sp. 80A-SIGWE]